MTAVDNVDRDGVKAATTVGNKGRPRPKRNISIYYFKIIVKVPGTESLRGTWHKLGGTTTT